MKRSKTYYELAHAREDRKSKHHPSLNERKINKQLDSFSLFKYKIRLERRLKFCYN